MTEATAAEPLTPQSASMQLEQLRADRMAGKVLADEAFFDRFDYLARRANGEEVAPPPAAPATHEERVRQELNEAFAPPRDALGYALPVSSTHSEEHARELHDVAGKAFLAAEIPALYGASIMKNLLSADAELGKQSAEQREVVVREAGAQLRAQWGDSFDARIAAIDNLLEVMGKADPRVASIIERSPWLFAGNPLTMFMLDSIAQHRLARGTSGR